jgi:hypothetical protein
MPLHEKDKSVNQKFSDMQIGPEGRMDEMAMQMVYGRFDSTDEVSF